MANQIPDIYMTLLQQIHDDVQAVRSYVGYMREEIKDVDKRLTAHIVEEEETMQKLEAEVSSFHQAIPNGDMVGHNLYHQSIITRNEWIIQVCKDVTREIAKYGLIGAIGWAAYHAWIDFLAGPK